MIKHLLFTLFIISYSLSILAQSEYSASINGSLIKDKTNRAAKSESENGIYWCTYDIKAVSDEMRYLINFNFYKNNALLFTLIDVPGSDVEISNAGYIVFYDHSFHFNRKLVVHFFTPEGINIGSKKFDGANLFQFSQSGNLFGVGSPDGIKIISLADLSVQTYPKGFQFSISEDDKFITIASENLIEIFENEISIMKINSEFKHTRKIIVSTSNNVIAAIDKHSLKVYSLKNGKLRFSNLLTNNRSYRDLRIVDNNILTGVHFRDSEESRGELVLFDLNGTKTELKTGQSKYLENNSGHQLKKSENSYEPIPWPFAPFDSMRTVWNHYEQHMGGYGSDYSYLHQGLDLITPIAEPTYAVKSGVVKCVLTLGGAIYWRIGISDSLVDDYANGWLYAHLIENTIQFDVGDTIQVHDYLGDIVEWTSEWGHIHFVEIRDSGMVWFYDDNEWGINFNPLLALAPLPDTTPPTIDNVFTDQLFGFCINESSTYLQADALSGDVDIIVKVFDYAGDSEWQQPAYKIDYWIKRISDDEVVQPRKMAHILNHTYPFYSGDNYEPFATVMYKRDAVLFPTSWMETERNYHHVITNSDGDSSITLDEKNLALATRDFYDSEYIIYVEVFDQSGNFATDSMIVFFNNGISDVEDKSIPSAFSLTQNYPNPFNPSTIIRYAINTQQFVFLKVFDILGKEITILVSEEQAAGFYEVEFNSASSIKNLASGIYFYQLKAGDFISTKKMILIK